MKPIGQLLLEEGYITDEDLKKALEEQKTTRAPLGQILVESGLISPQTLGRFLSSQSGVSYKKLSEINLSPEVIGLLPENIIKSKKVLPLRIIDDVLEVAVLPPVNPLNLDIVREMTAHKVRPYLVTDMEFQQFLNKYFDLKRSGGGAFKGISIEEKKEVEALTEDTPTVRFVNTLLRDAINQNASDIHLDPTPEFVRVRYRLDGMLNDMMEIPLAVADSVIARVKILAGMDIAEKRRSQDGRFSLEVGGRVFDFRVSSMETRHGEKIGVRLLKKAQIMIELSRLGMLEEQQKIYEKTIKRPHGLILVTGPTGSGKTTTLYASLHKINSPTKSIFTIEDPVEYELPGIMQTQINPKAGITFEKGIRSVLRLDPDIIMVGEIRDLETARTVVEGALTGHLVLSTLHTNDAPSAVIRLIELGVEPYLVASTMACVVAQRLLRTICSSCKEDYEATPEEKQILYPISQSESITLKKGVGCSLCNYTGYQGRTGIFEILPLSPRLREMITGTESSELLRKTAEMDGMINLLEACFTKVRKGITTLEEVLRVVPPKE